jgi:hypothetical protein
VETKYNIAFTDLLKWNPELNVACTSAWGLLSSFVRFHSPGWAFVQISSSTQPIAPRVPLARAARPSIQ